MPGLAQASPGDWLDCWHFGAAVSASDFGYIRALSITFGLIHVKYRSQ